LGFLSSALPWQFFLYIFFVNIRKARYASGPLKNNLTPKFGPEAFFIKKAAMNRDSVLILNLSRNILKQYTEEQFKFVSTVVSF